MALNSCSILKYRAGIECETIYGIVGVTLYGNVCVCVRTLNINM